MRIMDVSHELRVWRVGAKGVGFFNEGLAMSPVRQNRFQYFHSLKGFEWYDPAADCFLSRVIDCFDLFLDYEQLKK